MSMCFVEHAHTKYGHHLSSSFLSYMLLLQLTELYQKAIKSKKLYTEMDQTSKLQRTIRAGTLFNKIILYFWSEGLQLLFFKWDLPAPKCPLKFGSLTDRYLSLLLAASFYASSPDYSDNNSQAFVKI